jgi:hypothetical protein
MKVSNGYPAACHYVHMFGTWNDALIAAGFKINKIQDYSSNKVCFRCNSTETNRHWYYDDTNTICSRCYNKNYNHTHPDTFQNWKVNSPEKYKAMMDKGNARRRLYGFNPINKSSIQFEGHHLWLENNSDFVIYLPIFLHKPYRHNHNKPETMDTLNAIALDFWINEDFYYDLYEIYKGDVINGVQTKEEEKKVEDNNTTDNGGS